MKIKLNDKRVANWNFINIPVTEVEKGECIYHKYNHKYGYRFRIIQYKGKFYLTQTLYESPNNYEDVSVHQITSVSDAKAVIKVMERIIKQNAERKASSESDSSMVREA